MALALLGFPAMGGQESARAQGAVSFDIDPEITGNGADTLGTVENCYEVTCPSDECTWDGSSSFDDVSDYVIDVVVSGDTQAPSEYRAWLNYDEAKVHVADPGVETRIKMPGALNFSETPPDSDGGFDAGALYIMGGPGTAGNGTITRVGLDIGASGVVTFSFNASPLTAYVSAASGPDGHPLVLCTGMLAINQGCSVGGIAEIAVVSGSSGGNYVAVAVLAAAALVALAAGGWYARRRWVR
jgi:hypothetical protein